MSKEGRAYISKDPQVFDHIRGKVLKYLEKNGVEDHGVTISVNRLAKEISESYMTTWAMLCVLEESKIITRIRRGRQGMLIQLSKETEM